MENDTAHDLSEFKDFPWDKLEDAVNWEAIACTGKDPEFQVEMISRGGSYPGVDFNPMKPHINFLRRDASVEVWAIPESLAFFIDKLRKRAAQQREGEIKHQSRALIETLFGIDLPN